MACFWDSGNYHNATLCSCMNKWADVPEVSLISVAKGE